MSAEFVCNILFCSTFGQWFLLL